MPLQVRVTSGSAPTSSTSVARTYEPRREDLFVPFNYSPPFEDNNCSATQPYTVGVAAYAPPDARAPQPATLADHAQNLVGRAWQTLVITAVVLVVVAAAVIVWRRRALRLR